YPGVRGVPPSRAALGAPASLPLVRIRRLLRLVAESPCDGALLGERAPHRALPGARRDVAMVLRRRDRRLNQVHVAALGVGAVGDQLRRVPGEELVAPQAVVPELAAPPEAFRLADPEILAHALGPPLVEGTVDRVLCAAVEHGDQRFHPEVPDRAARHRAAGIDVGQLDIHLAALTAVCEEVLGAAP